MGKQLAAVPAIHVVGEVPSAPRTAIVSVSPERAVTHTTSFAPEVGFVSVIIKYCPKAGLGNREPVPAARVQVVGVVTVIGSNSVVAALLANIKIIVAPNKLQPSYTEMATAQLASLQKIARWLPVRYP